MSQYQTFVQLIRNRNFSLLCLGQFLSRLGDWALAVALPISVFQITGSAAALGVMVMIEIIPSLLVGPIAGVFVDRWDRRKVMFAADILRGLMVLSLLVVRSADQLWIVYIVGFANAGLGTFFMPARLALLPTLLEESALLTTNSVFQSGLLLARLIGPALGGVLVVSVGASIAFTLDAASFFLSAVTIFVMSVPAIVNTQIPTDERRFYGELLDGLKLLRRNRVLSSVLLVWAILMFSAGSIAAMLVVFVEQALRGTANDFGVLLSLQGLGMGIGAILTASFRARMSTLSIFKGGLLLFGPLFLVGANATSVAAAGFIVCLMGMAMSSVAIADQTIFQQQAPDAYRGRIMAINESVTSFAVLIAAGLSGVIAELIGVRVLFNLAALLAIGAAGVAVLLLPGVSRVVHGKPLALKG